nr:FIG01019293: hypothetical protein [uncultured bacterium]
MTSVLALLIRLSPSGAELLDPDGSALSPTTTSPAFPPDVMTSRSRILLALAALSLGLAYALPLWSVSLEAPQYPGGIGMLIWIDTITGINPHDLQNINGLNHYIGMQTIEPDSIPELRIMPRLFGVLIALGLGAALLGRRWALYAWTGLFTALLVVGFVDYFMWGYDYGHNLSPDAAIKIPGMAYQPPLIGGKKMLNFVAYSWPASGGLVLFGSFLTACILSVQAWRGQRRKRVSVPGRELALAAITLGLLAGCEPGPQPIRYGEDIGAHCRMTISDPRFGGQLVTTTGKTFSFDSVECLSGYIAENREAYHAAHSVWVTPFDRPGTLIPADDAFFLKSPAVASPMGGGLAAYADASVRDQDQLRLSGTPLDWAGVIDTAGETSSHAAHTR